MNITLNLDVLVLVILTGVGFAIHWDTMGWLALGLAIYSCLLHYGTACLATMAEHRYAADYQQPVPVATPIRKKNTASAAASGSTWDGKIVYAKED